MCLIVCIISGDCTQALASFQAQRDAHERAKQEAIEQCRVANECAAMGRPIGSQWCLSPSNNSATDPGEVGTILGLSGAAGSGGGGELKIEFSKKGTMVVRKEALITVEAWHQYETVLHSPFHLLAVFLWLFPVYTQYMHWSVLVSSFVPPFDLNKFYLGRVL